MCCLSLLASLSLAAAGRVQAAEVRDLYVGNVIVADQQEATRQQAVIDAFRQTLVKLSGNTAVLSSPVVQENLGKAAAYVQTYQYQSLPGLPQSGPAQPGATTPSAPQLRLSVSFDRRALDQLLQQAAAPVWGARRPLMLVWSAVGDASERHLLDAATDPAAIRVMQDAAAERGLPLVLPLMDLEEQTQISVTDVWGRFHETLLPLSRRYGAEAMLVGRAEKLAEGQWTGQWSLLHLQHNDTLTATGDSAESVLAQVVAQAAERLAGIYAVVLDRSKAAEMSIWVEGIRSAGDYGQVLQLLGSLQAVQQVDVRMVEGERVQFALQLIADSQALVQALGLDGRLVPVGDGSGAGADRWLWQP